MDRKAQGISLNVIIIAAIALIVLVVLVAIFTGRLGSFQKELGEVSDAEVFRVQAMSSSNCVPSKEGIHDVKARTTGLPELQAKAQYNEDIQQLILDCALWVEPRLTEDENRLNCNSAESCVWK